MTSCATSGCIKHKTGGTWVHIQARPPHLLTPLSLPASLRLEFPFNRKFNLPSPITKNRSRLYRLPELPSSLLSRLFRKMLCEKDGGYMLLRFPPSPAVTSCPTTTSSSPTPGSLRGLPTERRRATGGRKVPRREVEWIQRHHLFLSVYFFSFISFRRETGTKR